MLLGKLLTGLICAIVTRDKNRVETQKANRNPRLVKMKYKNWTCTYALLLTYFNVKSNID